MLNSRALNNNNSSFFYNDSFKDRYSRGRTPTTAKPNDGCTRFRKGLFRAGHDFCLETSIHGFNHIAEPKRHWIERLLWAFVTAAAIWGAIDISLGQWQRFNDNPTVVTLEKDFRTWKFSLPAITECDCNKTDRVKVAAAIKALWDVEPGDENYAYYSDFVDTVANSDLLNLKRFQKYAEDQSLQVDLFQLAVDVRPEHSVKATWADGHNPNWIPIMTESGICHVTNSLAVADIALVKIDANDTKDLPLTCQYPALSCYVIMDIFYNFTFVAHSPYDIVDVSSPAAHIYLTMKRRTELSVLETRCGEGVRDLSVKRRGCLYLDEPVGAGKQVYSSNMCRRTCRNDFAVEKCGCRPFYNFYEEGKPCSASGMACLAKYSLELATLKCTCMLQCVDAVFKELTHEDEFWLTCCRMYHLLFLDVGHGLYGQDNTELQCFNVSFKELTHKNEFWDKGPFLTRGQVRYTVGSPRTRYTREIVFHFQDLVVSFGGAAGLFLGASFLSFVEIFYFIFERILRRCFKTAPVSVPIKKPEVARQIPYEAARIMELDRILKKDFGRRLYSEQF